MKCLGVVLSFLSLLFCVRLVATAQDVGINHDAVASDDSSFTENRSMQTDNAHQCHEEPDIVCVPEDTYDCMYTAYTDEDIAHPVPGFSVVIDLQPELLATGLLEDDFPQVLEENLCDMLTDPDIDALTTSFIEDDGTGPIMLRLVLSDHNNGVLVYCKLSDIARRQDSEKLMSIPLCAAVFFINKGPYVEEEIFSALRTHIYSLIQGFCFDTFDEE